MSCACGIKCGGSAPNTMQSKPARYAVAGWYSPRRQAGDTSEEESVAGWDKVTGWHSLTIALDFLLHHGRRPNFNV